MKNLDISKEEEKDSSFLTDFSSEDDCDIVLAFYIGVIIVVINNFEFWFFRNSDLQFLVLQWIRVGLW